MHAMFAASPPALPHIRTGKLKAIAVSNAKRSPNLPDIPAVSETVPGFDAENWYGLMAPAGTPQQIILKLNAEIARFLKDPGVAQKLSVEGFVVVASSPQDFSRYLQSELVKWRTVIKAIGIRAD
jgi:tripartite-type tricarboxylate transporter receptor subunit TctC